MHTKRQAGFTLVELLIGMIAAAVLAWAAIFMLVVEYDCWFHGGKLVDLQRETSVAVVALHRNLREMTYSQAQAFIASNSASLGISGVTYDASRCEMKMTLAKSNVESGVGMTFSNLSVRLRNEP